MTLGRAIIAGPRSRTADTIAPAPVEKPETKQTVVHRSEQVTSLWFRNGCISIAVKIDGDTPETVASVGAANLTSRSATFDSSAVTTVSAPASPHRRIDSPKPG